MFIITPILKSLVVPVIWLVLIGAIYSRIAPFFALNCIFFPANEATLKRKQPIRFQGLFKVTNQIAGKWKTKSIMWQILQLLFTKLLLPPPKKKKWMILITDQLSIALIKYLNWLSPVFGRFQNGCNKVIKCHAILVWNHTCDFKSRVWFQPKLHSTQFNYHCLFIYLYFTHFFTSLLNFSKTIHNRTKCWWCLRSLQLTNTD